MQINCLSEEESNLLNSCVAFVWLRSIACLLWKHQQDGVICSGVLYASTLNLLSVYLIPSCSKSQEWVWWGWESSPGSGWSDQVSTKPEYKGASLPIMQSLLFIMFITRQSNFQQVLWMILLHYWITFEFLFVCRNLEKEISFDFGPNAEFAYLYSQCYELSTSEYVHTLTLERIVVFINICYKFLLPRE